MGQTQSRTSEELELPPTGTRSAPYVLDLEARTERYLKSAPSHKDHKGHGWRITFENVRFWPAVSSYKNCGDGELPVPQPCVVDKSELICDGEQDEHTVHYRVSHTSRFRFRAEYKSFIQTQMTPLGPALLMPLRVPPELEVETLSPAPAYSAGKAQSLSQFSESPKGQAQTGTVSPSSAEPPDAAVKSRVLYLNSTHPELVEHLTTHDVTTIVTVKRGEKMRIVTEVLETSFRRNFSQEIRMSGKVTVRYSHRGDPAGRRDIPVKALFNLDDADLRLPTNILIRNSTSKGDISFVVKGVCLCQMTGELKTRTEKIDTDGEWLRDI